MSPIPSQTLASIPGMTLEKMTLFNQEFQSKTLHKERILCTRRLLESIMGKELSRMFQKEASFMVNVSHKELLKRPVADSQRKNFLLEQDSAASLESLFGSE